MQEFMRSTEGRSFGAVSVNELAPRVVHGCQRCQCSGIIKETESELGTATRRTRSISSAPGRR